MLVGEVDDALIGVLSTLALGPNHHIDEFLEPLVILIGF